MIEMKVTNLHQVVSIDDDFLLVDEIQELVKQVLKIEIQKIQTDPLRREINPWWIHTFLHPMSLQKQNKYKFSVKEVRRGNKQESRKK